VIPAQRANDERSERVFFVLRGSYGARMSAGNGHSTTELLYPFYLDTDMSMAFAAALSGGVALESEHTLRLEDASRAVENLRGSLRNLETEPSSVVPDALATNQRSDEATLTRRHSTHSIFIALHDELRASGRLIMSPAFADLAGGELVSMQLAPAIAPLRRVIDQVLRLLDLMAPVMGLDLAEESAPASRQERRQRAREAAKTSSPGTSDPEGIDALAAIRNLFIALRDDLDHSGMVDVVVAAESGPGVILTLDKRFADPTALELLHTSHFTVIGKVTHVWPTDEDAVLLYRRSALSLVPALSQQLTVGVFTFLIGMAKAIGVVDVEEQVTEAIRGDQAPKVEAPAAASGDQAPSDTESGESEVGETGLDDDVLVGNDVAALNPVLMGPAIQILPLALCV
jgi:hypothetical protein